jgi:hypothetical protein
MKNLFLLLAFTGILNVASAQDGKKSACKKDSTHHNCTKHDKAKCDMKKDSTHHDCSKHTKGKCCKPKKDSVAH